MKARALIVLCVVLTVLNLPLAPAGAADGSERYTEWYSDATKTDVVGWRQENCGGSVDSYGYQTAYKEIWIGNRCEDGGGWAGYACGYSYQGGQPVCPAQCAYCYFS
jgi:hypothetical protein